MWSEFVCIFMLCTEVPQAQSAALSGLIKIQHEKFKHEHLEQ